MKVAATKGYGAQVYFSGSTAPEREALASEVMEKTGARLVPPYDHPDVILGQGKHSLFQSCGRTPHITPFGAACRAWKREVLAYTR